MNYVKAPAQVVTEDGEAVVGEALRTPATGGASEETAAGSSTVAGAGSLVPQFKTAKQPSLIP
ncbi:MAG: hypothetical protein AB1668_02075 [Nanoarchaeota archaeon]